jgi:hypothetical protein
MARARRNQTFDDALPDGIGVKLQLGQAGMRNRHVSLQPLTSGAEKAPSSRGGSR